MFIYQRVIIVTRWGPLDSQTGFLWHVNEILMGNESDSDGGSWYDQLPPFAPLLEEFHGIIIIIIINISISIIIIIIIVYCDTLWDSTTGRQANQTVAIYRWETLFQWEYESRILMGYTMVYIPWYSNRAMENPHFCRKFAQRTTPPWLGQRGFSSQLWIWWQRIFWDVLTKWWGSNQ